MIDLSQATLERTIAKEKRKEAKAAKKKAWQEAHLFYDVKVDLSLKQDGSQMRTIRKRRPYMAIVFICCLVLVFGLCFLAIDFKTFKGFKWDQFGAIFVAMFTPMAYSTNDWSGWWHYVGDDALKTIWETTEMCFISSLIGAIISIPVYYLSSRNITPKGLVRTPVRVVNDLLRTIPTMLLAMFFENFWGYSAVSGVAAMTIFTIGIMYQLMYEYIETLEMSPFESARSCGGTTLQAVHLGLHPEIKPMFFANFLYTFEINIRASVILGYVGAGGYGYTMKECIGQGQYDKVGALLLPLFIEVMFLQIVTNFVARKMR